MTTAALLVRGICHDILLTVDQQALEPSDRWTSRAVHRIRGRPCDHNSSDGCGSSETGHSAAERAARSPRTLPSQPLAVFQETETHPDSIFSVLRFLFSCPSANADSNFCVETPALCLQDKKGNCAPRVEDTFRSMGMATSSLNPTSSVRPRTHETGATAVGPAKKR